VLSVKTIQLSLGVFAYVYKLLHCLFADMLTETVVAVFLLFWLWCFFSVNLHNIVKRQKLRKGEKVYAEVERPIVSTIGLAAVGTFVYFVEVFSYLFLTFSGRIFGLHDFPFLFQFPFIFYVQIPGLVLTSVGYFVFIWSVVVRGEYAVSWAMTQNQKLVTSGPYRYVRHPSYLGYFLMFFGLFFLWPNLFTVFPLLAIPGYFRVTFEEERLLARRFGDEYVEYQRKTGRFVPRFRN
jgi:protein-S-isoprenylcysteine O-methyltransferase Ste14